MANNESRLYAWQRRLLPFLMGSLIFLAVVFFTVSYLQIRRIQNIVERKPSADFEKVFESYEKSAYADVNKPSEDFLRWRSLILIEKYAIENRYHQANALLMSRILLIYLGFLTGMVLCFAGGTFILGKLTENVTNITADTPVWKISIASSSPGLILSVIGVLLIVTTILSKTDISVNDSSLYLPETAILRDQNNSRNFEEFPGTSDSSSINGQEKVTFRDASDPDRSGRK